MKELTKAEEQIMHVIWQLDKAFVKDILAELPIPKPAYNTVSTVVRILAEKGFLDYEAFGKSHRYFPIVSKAEYREFATGKLLSGYFGGKVENLVSYFAQEKNLSLQDLQEILEAANQSTNDPNQNQEP